MTCRSTKQKYLRIPASLCEESKVLVSWGVVLWCGNAAVRPIAAVERHCPK